MSSFGCDRYWLLTWTTYGTWLPGDSRGFVSNVRIGHGPEVRLNVPGTVGAPDMPALEDYVRKRLPIPPILLTCEQAEALLPQFQETAAYRGWLLIAVAIMANHVHVVVGVQGDPDPDTILRDFKAYGSRALNRAFEKPTGGTWWTESGSKRKLKTDDAILTATRYVRDQKFPLVLWIQPDFVRELATGYSTAENGAV